MSLRPIALNQSVSELPILLGLAFVVFGFFVI